MYGLIILLAILALVIAVVSTNIRIVPQTEAWVIERLGSYQTTWQAGLHIKIPFIDRIVIRANLKEKVFDFPPQPVITKDNVTIMIDTVVYSQVTDAKLYAYGTDNPTRAIENLTATTLRNIIGDMELDSTLTSRDEINKKMCLILDEATDPWGIKYSCRLITFGYLNCTFLITLSFDNLCTAVTLCFHLSFHSIFDFFWRINRLDFNTNYLNSPRISSLIKYKTHLFVNFIS